MSPHAEPQQPGTRVFRGRTLDVLLPRIRAELGADAVVVGQRESRVGGFAGFFQHPVVEIAARRAPDGAAVGRIDMYATGDGEGDGAGDAADAGDGADPVPGPSTALTVALLDPSPVGFADHLGAAVVDQASGLTVVPAELARVDGRRPAAADALEVRLVDAGIPAALAVAVVAETVSHGLPFGTARQLRRLVRGTLARHIPVEPGVTGDRRTIAVVGGGGAGKTLAVARLAAAYATGSDLAVRVFALACGTSGVAELAAWLGPSGVAVAPLDGASDLGLGRATDGDGGLTVIDTASVSPGDPEGIQALGARLRALPIDEVHLVLPATVSRSAGEELLRATQPLGVGRLLLTHADETAHAGTAIGLAVDSGLPFSFVSRGTGMPGGLQPADAAELAAGVVR